MIKLTLLSSKVLIQNLWYDNFALICITGQLWKKLGIYYSLDQNPAYIVEGCYVTSFSIIKDLGVTLGSKLFLKIILSILPKLLLPPYAKLWKVLSVFDAEKLVHAFLPQD